MAKYGCIASRGRSREALSVRSSFQPGDEVPGRNNGDAFVLTKVEQVTDIAGHEVIGFPTDGCREKFVIIGIAAHPHAGKIDHEFRNLPQDKGHIKDAVAQPVPMANARAV